MSADFANQQAGVQVGKQMFKYIWTGSICNQIL